MVEVSDIFFRINLGIVFACVFIEGLFLPFMNIFRPNSVIVLAKMISLYGLSYYLI